ncbi:protein HEXIM1-like [Planococcus citri]|uniref:protein HEXIM1-like n=1 Tax=Planococcus citri TaxID=170843 RepID=UPI0031F9A23F
MDVISVVNNDSSSHFESDGVTRTPSKEAKLNDALSTTLEDRSAEGDRIRRKRKTRRFKSRYKNKSSKNPKYSKKMRSRTSYPQSEAPNNTNEFLMADHDNIENLDEKIVVPEFARDGSRARESSFTSVDTDEYYSSPDNDEDDEYFTKDFDNTYQSVCAEKLVGMSKPQLAKMILDLENKVDELNKKKSGSNQMSDILKQVNGFDNKELSNEIKEIVRENERLRNENEALQRFIKENAVTWSSSSSSSSNDSDSDSPMSEAENNSTTADNQRISTNVANTTTSTTTTTEADDDPA